MKLIRKMPGIGRTTEVHESLRTITHFSPDKTNRKSGKGDRADASSVKI